MDRLVYSPRVEAYVRTTDGILDISPYIVSGSVNRVVNEVSTAELVIRNPKKQFTKPGDPTFMPMDGITIFGSRYKDKPVQLFTGYLDSTPYLQLFPGTCTLRASCTLKRLLYTYWDTGLPYVTNWLASYDWLPQEGGTIMNRAAAQNKTAKTDAQGNKIPEIITDGSFGTLLYNFLREIGNWDKDQILVEALPKGILETVQSILERQAPLTSQEQTEFHDFLHELIGEFAIGGGTGTEPGSGIPGGSLGGGANPPSKTIVTPEQVGMEMLYAGFPADEKVIASGIETVEAESAFGAGNEADGWGLNDYGCCAGYWQIYLSVHGVSMECANNLRCSTKFALGLWKSAGNCFACQAGPNPWQGGTDSGTKYLSVARRCIEQAKSDSGTDNNKDRGDGVR